MRWLQPIINDNLGLDSSGPALPVPARSWLWRRGPRRLTGNESGEPLFFHHVAKTGGTSFVEAMRNITPQELQSTQPGSLSVEFVQKLLERGLRPGEFIYGHVATGAALPLRGRTRIITLLREPCEQAISNFHALLNDYRLPDARAAWRLGFRGFLLNYPYFAIFQTGSLHVGIEQTPLRRTEDLIDRAPVILDYLDEMHAVATPRTAAALLSRLAKERGINDPRSYPHRTRTRLLPARRKALQEQYADLSRHPQLGPLIAAEQALYQKALERVATCGLMPSSGPSGQ
jgi:hypothetical protein